MPLYQLHTRLWFPPPDHAEDGLLAVGGDLSPERLVLAYSHGIFPWYSEDEPILWWSPDPRMILTANALRVSRRLQRTLRQQKFRLTIDSAFPEVIRQCAATPRRHEKGTWIMPEMIEAYIRLHDLGLAHSFEVWLDRELVGGLYGVSLGAAFFGESMFSHVPDASKVALVRLVEHCTRRGIELIDCQVANPHLVSMGALEIARSEFLQRLEQAMKRPTQQGAWAHPEYASDD